MVNETLFIELRDLSIILFAHAREMRSIMAESRNGRLKDMERWYDLKNECERIIDQWERKYETVFHPSVLPDRST